MTHETGPWLSSDRWWRRITSSSLLLFAGALVFAASGVMAAPNPPVLVSINGNPVSTVDSFTGLPLTSDGWTDLLAMYQNPNYYTDSHIIYVSSSQGDDSTAQYYTPGSAAIGSDPFHPATAVKAYKTVRAAVAQMRNGYPDILLFRRGDTFTSGVGAWTTNGKSAAQPQIIASYGSASTRPFFALSGQPLIYTNGGSAFPSSVNYLIIADLKAEQVVKDPSRPEFQSGLGNTPLVQFQWTSDHVLLEDLYLRFGEVDIMYAPTNFAVRRSVIVDDYSANGGHAQGLFASKANGLLIEGNVFDHNGWNDSVSGASPTIFNHNMYIQDDCQNVVVKGNISARASSHGLQLRPGGNIERNLFLSNSLNVLIGGGNSPVPGGVKGTVSYNVVMGAKDINASTPRGTGIAGENLDDVQVSNNLIAYISSASTGNKQPLNLAMSSTTNRLIVSNNTVWDWDGQTSLSGTPASGASVTYTGNRSDESSSVTLLQLGTSGLTSSNNEFASPKTDAFQIGSTSYDLSGYKAQVGDTTSATWAPTAGFAVPTIGDYAASIGVGSTLADFLTAARQQTKGNWNTNLTAQAATNYFFGAIGQ